jgi:Leu/Phe-tRNA-protein transferase
MRARSALFDVYGDHLRSRGLGWIDIQVMTPHMKHSGATTIGRSLFLRRLEETRRLGLTLF